MRRTLAIVFAAIGGVYCFAAHHVYAHSGGITNDVLNDLCIALTALALMVDNIRAPKPRRKKIVHFPPSR